MLPYQLQLIETFMKFISVGTTDILEIGSDIGGEVVTALAQRTSARIIGINPSPEFPKIVSPSEQNIFFLRSDGRSIPFSDNTFDAVLSVATMEHVNGLDIFLAEVNRVLKPKGLFFTEFCPIWSSAYGHHVYAVAGPKEARFWKAGKNPIPDYGHLLMTSDEMREYLRSGPCAEELIEPIIQWIYFGNSINRYHYEEYIESFRKCPLIIQHICFGYDSPDSDTLTKLYLKYGTALEFKCSSVSAVFRKIPEGAVHSLFFKGVIHARNMLGRLCSKQLTRMRFVMRMLDLPFCR